MNKDARELLAEVQHDIWGHWMQYLFSKCVDNEDGTTTIPSELVSRWKLQTITGYKFLSNKEQERDRHQADKVIEALRLVDASQLFKDNDIGFMVLAALRYCHGRMSYAPSLMVEWVKKYWEQLGDNTQELIRKETREYMQSIRSKGMECDRLTWESFAQWIEEN